MHFIEGFAQMELIGQRKINNKPQTEKTGNMEDLLNEINENDHELYLVMVKIYKVYGIEIKA